MDVTLPSSPGPLSRKERKKAKKKQKRRQDAILNSKAETPPVIHQDSPDQAELLQQWEEREARFQAEFKMRTALLKIKEEKEAEYRKKKETAALLQEEQRLARSIEKPEEDSRNCSFYLKTGCCKYGEACSKFHPRPETSHTLLFKNMYSVLGLAEPTDEEDEGFELEPTTYVTEDEIVEDFLRFWTDVVPEFEKFGEIKSLRVCRNYAPHMRGNVYVTYHRAEDAEKACNMTDWTKALCGMYSRNECQRGNGCNFIHVFKNPGGKYTDDSRMFQVLAAVDKRIQNGRPFDPPGCSRLVDGNRDKKEDRHDRDEGRHDRRYDNSRDRRHDRDLRNDSHKSDYHNDRRERDHRRDRDDRSDGDDRWSASRRRDREEHDEERGKKRHHSEEQPESKRRKTEEREGIPP